MHAKCSCKCCVVVEIVVVAVVAVAVVVASVFVIAVEVIAVEVVAVEVVAVELPGQLLARETFLLAHADYRSQDAIVLSLSI